MPRPEPNPTAYCLCGCGERTGIAPRSRSARGWLEGQPMRYVAGHQRRKSPIEYLVDPETGCWNWQRARDGHGYGVATRGKRKAKAHRLVYERHVGPIPPGLELDHLCRNRACVNPEHLEPVTRLTNVLRGLATRITPEEVRQIRAATGSARAIGRRFGVSHGHVLKIKRGQIRAEVATFGPEELAA